LKALPMLLSGRARLLDDATLRRQLAGLERRVHVGGRESVSHAAAASAHDDVAAAACGALNAVGSVSNYTAALMRGPPPPPVFGRSGRPIWQHPSYGR
jgi:hypothetical protein